MRWTVANILNVVLAADVGKRLNAAYRNEQTEASGSPSNTTLPSLDLLGPAPQLSGVGLDGPIDGQPGESVGSSSTPAVDTATHAKSTTATAPKTTTEKDFEDLRQETIARNKELMKKLGLGSGLPEPKAASKRKKREKSSASAAPTRKSQRNKKSNEPPPNADGTGSSEPPSTTTASSQPSVTTSPQATGPGAADKEAPAGSEELAPGGQLALPQTTTQPATSPGGSSTAKGASPATTADTEVPLSTNNDTAPPSLSTPPTTSLDTSESARVEHVGTPAQTTLLTGPNSASSDVLNAVDAVKTVPAPRASSIDPPPRAPSVDVSSLSADNSAMPEWMTDALQYFQLIEGGEGWKQLLVEWLEFEKVSGYPNGQVRLLGVIYLFLCN